MRNHGYWIRIRNDVLDGMEPECFSTLRLAMIEARKRLVGYYVNTTAEIWYDRVDLAPFQAHDRAFFHDSAHVATLICRQRNNGKKFAATTHQRKSGWR